jgi:signal transduction histidine kinase
VDNAIKYTPSSGLITVRAEKEGGHIVFSVNDTGPGIPPRERERIFEQFAQVEGEKLSHRGFGLGLAFCKLAIAAHGGKIWVEDGEGGVGSQFKFTLPIES